MDDPGLTDQFIQQYENTIEKGGDKYSLGGLIAVGIDIESKNDRIGQQGNAADRGKQLFVRS